MYFGQGNCIHLQRCQVELSERKVGVTVSLLIYDSHYYGQGRRMIGEGWGFSKLTTHLQDL